jgi:hypothetical protein
VPNATACSRATPEASVAANTDPTSATPNTCPSERAKVDAAVTTPMSWGGVAFCTASV